MQTLPDIVCIDIGMPGLNGIEATRSLLASQADVRVIALSANVDPAAILELLDAGVAGYVSCDEGWKGLLRAILGVGRYQKTYLGPSVAADVLVALRAKRRALGALQALAADQGV
jgi:two-component system NarL family response regulator